MANRKRTHSVSRMASRRRKRRLRFTWKLVLEGLASFLLLVVLIWYLAYLAIEGDSVWHKIIVVFIVCSMILVTRGYLRERR